MIKQLSVAATLLLFAVACKTDAPTPAASGATPAGESSGNVRSAKIDVKPVAPPAAQAPGTAPAERPRLDPAARDEWRERRMARLDTDGDGTVSEPERAAAMHERMVNMHSKLDADADGKLTVAELGAGRRGMQFDQPETADLNHDGDISADELVAAVKVRREQRRLERTSAGSAAAGSATP